MLCLLSLLKTRAFVSFNKTAAWRRRLPVQGEKSGPRGETLLEQGQGEAIFISKLRKDFCTVVLQQTWPQDELVL